VVEFGGALGGRDLGKQTRRESVAKANYNEMILRVYFDRNIAMKGTRKCRYPTTQSKRLKR
jgi:hypothetical protein